MAGWYKCGTTLTSFQLHKICVQENMSVSLFHSCLQCPTDASTQQVLEAAQNEWDNVTTIQAGKAIEVAVFAQKSRCWAHLLHFRGSVLRMKQMVLSESRFIEQCNVIS